MKQLERKLQKQEQVNLPRDKIGFFQEVLGLVPFPYQGEFLLDPSPLKVLRWPRRSGKTTIMSGDDLYYAMLYPNSKIIVTMPKFQQVKEIYFQALHEHLARINRRIYSAVVESELQTIIRFNNGSVILAETPEPFTIRGHGPRKISIDEMNFIRRDKDLWLSALLPMTLTNIVNINVASTPWNKDSVYHSMCFDKSFRIFSGNVWNGLPDNCKDPGAAKYLLTFNDVMRPKGPLDPYQVEVMREQYAGDPWRWRREMESSFVDDESAFLPSSLIIKCQNDDFAFVDFETVLEGNFYIGWDLGRERDFSVVAIVDKQPDLVQLIHCRQFPLGTPYVSVMAYIKSICNRWRYVRSVWYDHTGTKGMDEEINKAGFPGVKGVDFTKTTKHGMAMNMKQLMMTPRESDKTLSVDQARRRFELPCDLDVQAELNNVQWEQPTGSEIYSFSHPEGAHDDRFWAIALACASATAETTSPKLIEAFKFG